MIVKSFFSANNDTYFKEYGRFEKIFDKGIHTVEDNLKQYKEYIIKINIDGGDNAKGYLYCYFFKDKKESINFDNIIFKNDGNKKDIFYYKLNDKKQKIKRISELNNRKCFYFGELFCSGDKSFLFKGACCANELKNEIDKIINLVDNKEINEYRMRYIHCC